MNEPTPASFAPGVSVLGIITSAISATKACKSLVRLNAAPDVASPDALQPFKIAIIVGAETTPPIMRATLCNASLLFNLI